MTLVTVSYEECMERFFKKEMARREEMLSRYTGYNSTAAVQDMCSELGLEIQYYRDAMEAVKLRNLHAHWIEKECGMYFMCSACQGLRNVPSAYCEKCGAKMED